MHPAFASFAVIVIDQEIEAEAAAEEFRGQSANLQGKEQIVEGPGTFPLCLQADSAGDRFPVKSRRGMVHKNFGTTGIRQSRADLPKSILRRKFEADLQAVALPDGKTGVRLTVDVVGHLCPDLQGGLSSGEPDVRAEILRTFPDAVFQRRIRFCKRNNSGLFLQLKIRFSIVVLPDPFCRVDRNPQGGPDLAALA